MSAMVSKEYRLRVKAGPGIEHVEGKQYATLKGAKIAAQNHIRKAFGLYRTYYQIDVEYRRGNVTYLYPIR